MEFERLSDVGIWVMAQTDTDYPSRLTARLGRGAPPVLFGAGDRALLDGGGLAVVGSRDSAESAIDAALSVGQRVAKGGATIISGAARGIDQAAMEGAVQASGRVVGVVADRLDRRIRDKALRDPIASGLMALVTPYVPSAGFSVRTAMGRNKVIYGLADAAVVMSSAAGKGGTWEGAVEAIKVGHIPVYVWSGAPADGRQALMGAGALPWPATAEAGPIKSEDIHSWPRAQAPQPQLGLFEPPTDTLNGEDKTFAGSRSANPRQIGVAESETPQLSAGTDGAGKSAPIRLRIDLVAKAVEFDDATRTMSAVLVPDPRRYEHRENDDGKSGWYDRFDYAFIPDDVFAEAVNGMVGVPMYHQPQEIGDAAAYVRSRRAAIELALEGKVPDPTFEDKSEAFLESLAKDELGFVIMSVDVVGSTALSQAVGAREYAEVIALMVSELSLVIPQFHGHVLNYTGDGFIAYFAEPSFTTKNDLAIDAALTIRLLLYQAINPALQARGRPRLGVRIGLDAGDAVVVTLGHPRTKQHKDVIGAVVNLAAKIQNRAEPGSILVSETVDQNLHVSWREQLEEVEPGPNWPYKGLNGDPYRLFRVGRDPNSGPPGFGDDPPAT